MTVLWGKGHVKICNSGAETFEVRVLAETPQKASITLYTSTGLQV